MLLRKDSSRRAFWKLGKVEELIPGKDGEVRAAVVKVGRNLRHPALLRRAMQHLILIEIKADPEEIAPDVTRTLIDIVRPRCTAAVVGEINR